jgi:hypothetical protein
MKYDEGCYHTPWYRFWRPASGFFGGLISGAVLIAIGWGTGALTLQAAAWWAWAFHHA